MVCTAKFADNFYVFDNGMVRQFLITGSDEAILIDTGFSADHVRDAVRAVTDLPVRVIMTHGDIDHADGLKDFGKCRIHRADWNLISGDITTEPLEEGDVFECGGYRLVTIEIPGHTYGSVAFYDREKRLLLPGDSVQKDGPIYMFGSHRNLDLYIESQKKLCALADKVDTIIPCHHDWPIGPEYISRNLEDAEAMRKGGLPGTPHPEMPCTVYQGRWTAFYGERSI